MTEFAYVNGDILPIEKAQIGINDLGLLRGYGVFDFFRAIDGQPVFMEKHLDRFENSMRLLNLNLPVSREHLRENIREIVRLNVHPLLGIRLVGTGGYSLDGYTPAEKPNLLMIAKPFAFAPFDKTMRLMLVEHERDLPEIKMLNYSLPISLLLKMKAENADDVLYHLNGFVSESSRSNFFMVKNGVLITPKSGVLRGITRRILMDLAAAEMPVEERDVTLAEVLAADEVFLSGSTKRVAPVVGIGQQGFSVGKYTRWLYDLLVKNEKA